MAPTNKPAGLRELLWPFGRFHVLGVAIIGSLALAVLTDATFWKAVGMAGAVFGLLWAAALFRSERHRQ